MPDLIWNKQIFNMFLNFVKLFYLDAEQISLWMECTAWGMHSKLHVPINRCTNTVDTTHFICTLFTFDTKPSCCLSSASILKKFYPSRPFVYLSGCLHSYFSTTVSACHEVLTFQCELQFIFNQKQPISIDSICNTYCI